MAKQLKGDVLLDYWKGTRQRTGRSPTRAEAELKLGVRWRLIATALWRLRQRGLLTELETVSSGNAVKTPSSPRTPKAKKVRTRSAPPPRSASKRLAEQPATVAAVAVPTSRALVASAPAGMRLVVLDVAAARLARDQSMARARSFEEIVEYFDALIGDADEPAALVARTQAPCAPPAAPASPAAPPARRMSPAPKVAAQAPTHRAARGERFVVVDVEGRELESHASRSDAIIALESLDDALRVVDRTSGNPVATKDGDDEDAPGSDRSSHEEE